MATGVGVWFTARVECSICTRAWVAVWPEGAERLECPGCGYMNTAPPTAERVEDGDDDGSAGTARD